MFAIALIVVLSAYLFFKVTCGRNDSSVCLVGKTALVTGGNAGIGYQVCLDLASRGCRIILTGRNNLEQAKKSIIEKTQNPLVEYRYVDFLSFKSVRELANSLNKTETKIDILINNAGVGGGQQTQKTEDGLHPVLQTNHFSPFLLTHLLLDLVKKSGPGARILFTSSNLAYFNIISEENLQNAKQSNLLFVNFFNYCNSKAANIITADLFARKLKNQGITVNSLHPGWVRTQIFHKYGKASTTAVRFLITTLEIALWIIGKSVFEGSQTTTYLAIAQNVQHISGKFFQDCVQFPKPRRTTNEKFVNRIWELSERCVQLQSHERLK